MLLQGLKPRIFNRLNKFSARWLTELAKDRGVRDHVRVMAAGDTERFGAM